MYVYSCMSTYTCVYIYTLYMCICVYIYTLYMCICPHPTQNYISCMCVYSHTRILQQAQESWVKNPILGLYIYMRGVCLCIHVHALRIFVCYSVLQCVAVCCSVLQCVTVCCSVLQCVAVCCSVLQCVAVHCNETFLSWIYI